MYFLLTPIRLVLEMNRGHALELKLLAILMLLQFATCIAWLRWLWLYWKFRSAMRRESIRIQVVLAVIAAAVANTPYPLRPTVDSIDVVITAVAVSATFALCLAIRASILQINTLTPKTD